MKYNRCNLPYSHEQIFLQQTLKRPVNVHVFGCFSNQGYGTLFLFTESFNTKKVVKIYQRALLPTSEESFRSYNDRIIQKDNDLKHRSHLCSQGKKENDVETLEFRLSITVTRQKPDRKCLTFFKEKIP